MKDSDADFNVGVAMGAVQCLTKTGIYIAMNGIVRPYHEMTRNMETGQFVTT